MFAIPTPRAPLGRLNGRWLVPAAALAVLAGCADERQLTVAKPADSPATTTSTWAPFSCGVAYQSTTTLSDADLAAYGVGSITESQRTCESWTGSDYRTYIQDTGTSSTDPEVTNDVTTTWYENGQARGFDANGTEVAGAMQVASDAFALGQASPEERQASYNDPYYGIYQGVNPEPCPNNPTQIICDPASPNRLPNGAKLGVSPASGRNPHAAQVGKKEHGFRRRALRALVANSDEIGRSPEGNRRFRSVKGDQETVILVDPATELMVGQEVTHPRGKSRTRFAWTRVRRAGGVDGYVRERMDVEDEDAQGRKTSHATVLITDITFNGAGQ
ncbi:MAG TPA: hypothetical protein VGB66_17420 [Longimicrobium sp.]